jgi:hypothetical protein
MRQLLPAEIQYLFAVAIAVGHWPSEDALECQFIPLENKASAEIGGNNELVFSSFVNKFLDAAKGVPIEPAFRFDRGNWRIGNWRIATNYKSRQTPLIFLPYWTGTRLVNDIMRSWPQRSTVYPVTICWEPSQDQTPSEHPYDILSVRSSYPPEAQLVEENTPEPPIATTNDRREISDVTTRSEHEEQNERERPAATANHRRGISDVMPRSEREEQHEQARPAARRGGKRVGASELEGLGIGGGEEAKGISEGRVTRTRKIRAPRAPGDELQ